MNQEITNGYLTKLSVIVPVFNGASTLELCLDALRNHSSEGTEIIVVNDRSTDSSSEIARRMDTRVIENTRSKGPAGARNAGAICAKGEIVLFIDADIVVSPTTIPKILEFFERNPQFTAVFGSYDEQPAAPNFLSQYKNLLHHFVHQTSSEEAVTFWAGCGAIRKEVFSALGGFNEKGYRHASVEDIELGFRLWKSHHRIYLDKAIQVKHLKRWNWVSLLRADILDRAYPWSKLIVQSGVMPKDLNLQSSQRWSSVLIGLFALIVLFSIYAYGWIRTTSSALSWGLFIAIVLLISLIILNRKLYTFFIRKRGWGFVVPAVFWHLFYYFYSGATFVLCWLIFKWKPANYSWAHLDQERRV